jgi:hypothetical protein
MLRLGLRIVAVSAALLMLPVVGQAHHAIQAQFDTNVETTVSAKLVKIDWINPHAWWHWEVTQADGTVTKLSTETVGPTGLRRMGLHDRRMWELGDGYQVSFNPDRNPEAKLGFTTQITLPSGRVIYLGFDQPGVQGGS